MDKTMKYYFLNNPKKLNKIYDQVLGKLSQMESLVEKESVLQKIRVSNLWKGKDFYDFPSLSINDSAIVDMTIYRKGFYKLTFTVTLFPDDQSVNPGATLIVSPADSMVAGKTKCIKSVYYLKDGRPHTYYLNFSAFENTINHLQCNLYNIGNHPGGSEKHINIENISLTFNSSEE
jgi:hypothetical protein